MSTGFTRTRTTPRAYENVGQGRAAPLMGIYVGFVKAVDDVTYMGRLSVWIPELGGDPTDHNSWYTCNYASPFAGATNIYNNTNGGDWTGSQQSYGMWFVPPDLNNEVVVCFINGDQSRGIWLGCLYQQNMNHMVPGLPGNNSTASLPVVEYNKKDSGQVNSQNRPIFNPLADQLKVQGLDQDFIRGVSTAGARRTNPVNSVYGILTPLQNQFVLDDNPEQPLIRLRTRTGVQVLLSDSDGSVYINSADGSNWVNLGADGTVEIYGLSDISIRSQSSLNLRADVDVNIEAGRTINMKARGDTLVRNTSQPSDEDQAHGGNINVNAYHDVNLTADNIYTYATNTYTRTAGNIFDTAEPANIMCKDGERSRSGNIYVKANGNIFINSNCNIAIQSLDNIYLQTSNLMYVDVEKQILVTANSNITVKSNANINIESASNLYFAGGNATIFGNSNVNLLSANGLVIESTEGLYICSTDYIAILVDGEINSSFLGPEHSDIIIASNNDIWISSMWNMYWASGNDTTIHTGGMLAEYVHWDRKLQEIHAGHDDLVVPDVYPFTVDIDPLDKDTTSVKMLKTFARDNVETETYTIPWARRGILPIYPTDLTMEDQEIDGPGQYSSVTRDTILYKLPFHEPYGYHSGALLGTDGAISETGSNIDPYTGQPILLGSIVPGSNFPMPLIGTPRQGMPPGTYTGNSYTQSGLAVYNYLGPNSALAPAASYQLSSEGTVYLIGFEGYNPLPYTGVKGDVFIGVAHALTGGEISKEVTNTPDGEIPWSQGLTDDQIMGLLQQDLYQSGDPVKQLPVAQTVQNTISALITQAQFDILVDFCWNITPPVFQGCDVVQQINQNNFDIAATLFINWNLVKGKPNQQILARRMSESSRFRGINTTL